MIALCVATFAGAGCSSSSVSTASTTTAKAPATTLPPLPALPFEMGQRIALGPSWQMIVDGATLDGTTLRVDVQLLNVGTAPFTLPGAAQLFAVRAGLYKPDQAVTGGTGDTAAVAGGATAKVRVEAKGFTPIAGSDPVLFLRGGALAGSKDTLVTLHLQ